MVVMNLKIIITTRIYGALADCLAIRHTTLIFWFIVTAA